MFANFHSNYSKSNIFYTNIESQFDIYDKYIDFYINYYAFVRIVVMMLPFVHLVFMFN